MHKKTAPTWYGMNDSSSAARGSITTATTQGSTHTPSPSTHPRVFAAPTIWCHQQRRYKSGMSPPALPDAASPSMPMNDVQFTAMPATSPSAQASVSVHLADEPATGSRSGILSQSASWHRAIR